jgi:putative nucleotidyltransferase with HDIG domain
VSCRPFWLRVFLLSFLPVALALAGSTWVIQLLVNRQVKDGLRESLRRTHAFLGRAQEHQELQNRRFLSIVAENPTLKAGIELAALERGSGDARRTLEDLLIDYGQRLSFDLLVASDSAGEPLAAVRGEGGLDAMPLEEAPRATAGVIRIAGRPYSISTLPVSLGEEAIGALTIGRILDLADFSATAVLTRNGKLVETNMAAKRPSELEAGLASCEPGAECELRIDGELFLSMPLEALALGEGYHLYSLQSVDAVQGPLQAVIRKVSLAAGSIALALVLLTSLASSASVVKPITTLTSKLESLPPDGVPPSLEIAASTREVDQLVASFNRASVQIREARDRTKRAHTQFIEAMASAVDARDVYTLGHSRRVSEYAIRLARRIGVPESELETLRVGGLLHDVGKIGVPDAVLRKPGRLSSEEFELIKEHPTIGRRIVEHVDGFSEYLPIIELHHENFDGSGYPSGLTGPETPLLARLVHVVDAYDAMTSDRPYRRGMTHEQAAEILRENAGSQFDPEMVVAFLELGPSVLIARDAPAGSFARDLGELGRNIGGSPAPLAKSTPL